MRIKDGFVLRQVAGQFVVIATGEASRNFHGMIKLNQTGADVWNGIAKGKTIEEIAGDWASDYGIEEAEARQDAEALLRKMIDAGFVEQ